MKLITALLIYFGDHEEAFLKDRMKEALKTFREEENLPAPFVCRETLKAMRVLKRKKS